MFTAEIVNCEELPSTSVDETVNIWLAPSVEIVLDAGHTPTPEESVHTKEYTTFPFHQPALFDNGVAVGLITGPATSVRTV